MTSSPSTIIPDRPDNRPGSPDYVQTRIRGRHRVIHQRGVDYRIQIIRLEDELAESQKTAERLAVDLGRARATATRLSEHSGLCFQLRRQVQQRDASLGELRKTLADQKAAAAAAQTFHNRQLIAVLEAAEFADEQHKGFKTGLASLRVSHDSITQLYLQARDERDELFKRLERAERAVRHTLRDHARTSAQLIAVGAQLVHCQADLLAAGGAAYPLSPHPADVSLGAAPVPVDAPAALPAALTPPTGEGATDIRRPSAEEESADVDLSLTVASLLCRNPGMDIRAFILPGEPVSPADSPRSESPGPDRCTGTGADRPRSVPSASSADSGSTFGESAFDPPSPRPLGATSPSGSPLCLSPAYSGRSPG